MGTRGVIPILVIVLAGCETTGERQEPDEVQQRAEEKRRKEELDAQHDAMRSVYEYLEARRFHWEDRHASAMDAAQPKWGAAIEKLQLLIDLNQAGIRKDEQKSLRVQVIRLFDEGGAMLSATVGPSYVSHGLISQWTEYRKLRYGNVLAEGALPSNHDVDAIEKRLIEEGAAKEKEEASRIPDRLAALESCIAPIPASMEEFQERLSANPVLN